MIDEAAKQFPGVAFSVTPAFGVHEKLGEVVLERAGVKSGSLAEPALSGVEGLGMTSE
jgi:hypothetical protein